jgi:predicted transcriptional regulator
MPDDFTPENEKRFTLRLDKSLFDRISVHAQHNRRSVAKEIENAIAMYVDYHDPLLAEMSRRYSEPPYSR